MRILFVCTGNTCRSPMAEALAQKIARDMGQDIEVLSAGASAFAGDTASHQAIQAMQERGIDLNIHRARPLTKELIEQADLVLCMTSSHRRAALRIAPQAEDKVFLLKGFADIGETDIADPFGQSVEVYRRVADEMEEAIHKALSRLSNGA